MWAVVVTDLYIERPLSHNLSPDFCTGGGRGGTFAVTDLYIKRTLSHNLSPDFCTDDDMDVCLGGYKPVY